MGHQRHEHQHPHDRNAKARMGLRKDQNAPLAAALILGHMDIAEAKQQCAELEEWVSSPEFAQASPEDRADTMRLLPHLRSIIAQMNATASESTPQPSP